MICGMHTHQQPHNHHHHHHCHCNHVRSDLLGLVSWDDCFVYNHIRFVGKIYWVWSVGMIIFGCSVGMIALFIFVSGIIILFIPVGTPECVEERWRLWPRQASYFISTYHMEYLLKSKELVETTKITLFINILN